MKSLNDSVLDIIIFEHQLNENGVGKMLAKELLKPTRELVSKIDEIVKVVAPKLKAIALSLMHDNEKIKDPNLPLEKIINDPISTTKQLIVKCINRQLCNEKNNCLETFNSIEELIFEELNA